MTYQRKPNCECAECQKPIYRRPHEIAAHKVYCSCKCAKARTRIEHPCPVCGKTVLGTKNSITCSKECDRKRRGITITKSNSESVLSLRQTRKASMIKILGGKCTICGYNRCSAALEAHHINPSKKEFILTGKYLQYAWSRVLSEIEKCILLCANCHREYHAGMITLPE